MGVVETNSTSAGLDRFTIHNRWTDLPSTTERAVQAMFQASMTVEVGNGARTVFWTVCWINGSSVQQIASEVWCAVLDKVRKGRLVADALAQDRWVDDITGALSRQGIRQYLHLWDIMQEISIAPQRDDKFIWKWTKNQQYSAALAYRAFFIGQCGIPCAKELSKTRATPRCKLFFWPVLLGCCWTSNRLQRHNLQNSGPCALCDQESETLEHLLLGCVYSREVWFRLLCFSGLEYLT